jgi:putative tryptophan/tyrosine transport system substrate-binding protein
MRRRSFIVGLMGTATVGTALAQQRERVYRIAMVSPKTAIAEMTEARFPALFAELGRLGYAERQNLLIERYSGEGLVANYAEMARDVVRRKPDLICVINGGVALLPIFKAATATIPIVGVTGFPVQYGIAASLAHPGGNITGVTVQVGPEIMGKRLEILREVVPRMSKVALLATRGYMQTPSVVALREVASQMNVSLVEAGVEAPFDEPEFRRVFADLSSQNVDALIVFDEAVVLENSVFIVAQAKEKRIATIYPFRGYVDAGGLMAYANDSVEIYRHLADEIDMVLKGTSPADIPFYQPSKFSLIINLKTAKELGLVIPSTLLARADEVIE